MPSSDLVRWGGLAAMAAGVAFIVDILFVLTVDADWTVLCSEPNYLL